MSSKTVILIAIGLNVAMALLGFVDRPDLNLRALAFFGVAGALAGLISLLHANIRNQAADEARDEALAGDDPAALFQTEQGSGIRQRSLKQFERVILPAFVVVLALVELVLGVLLWRGVGVGDYTQPLGTTRTVAAIQLVSAVLLYLYGSYVAGLAYRAGHAVLRAVAGELVQLGGLAGVTGVVTLLRLGRGLPDPGPFWARFLAVYLIIRAVEKGFTVLLEIYRPRRRDTDERLLHESRIAGLFAEPRGVLGNLLDTLHYQFGIEVSEAGLKRFLWRGIPALLLVELVILLLASSLVFVQGGERVVLERAGKPHPSRPVLQPGAHLKLPWPFEKTYRVRVNQIHSVEIGADGPRPPDADEPEPDAPVLWTRPDWQAGAVFLAANASSAPGETGVSMNLATLKARVNYRIADPSAYLYATSDPDTLIRYLARREFARRLAASDLSSVLNARSDDLGASIAQQLQARLDELGMGVTVVTVTIHSLQPPPAVAAAFEDVFSASEAREGQVLGAHAEAIRATSANASDVQRVISDATADRHRVVLQSQAEAEAFIQLYEQYRRHPRLFTERLYLSTLERALANRRIVIVPAGQDDRVITIDLKQQDMTDILNFQPNQ